MATSTADSGLSERSGSVQIFVMESRDLDEVVKLEERSFSSPWPRESFEYVVRDPFVWALVARTVDCMTGYLIAIIRGRGILIANLAIKESFQRLGIAQQLIRTVLDKARLRHLHYAILDVRESNAQAYSLYSKLGFEVVGRRPAYYSDPEEDALVMKKILNRS